MRIPRSVTLPIIPHRRTKIDTTSDIPVNFQEQYGDFTTTTPEEEYSRALAEHRERMNSLDPAIKEALNIYIEWLNQPNGDDGQYNVEFEDFFRYTGTNEKGTFWEQHYETSGIVDSKFADHRFICISAGTADDGGAAYLYITVDESYRGQSVVSIVQEFDTMHSLVYFASEGFEKEERAKGIVPFAWSPQENPGETSQA